MTMYVGLDVHSKDTKCVVKDHECKELGRMVTPTTEEGFRQLLKRFGLTAKTRIGLETGCQARWVFQVLTRLGMDPVVIDAGEVRAKQGRKKRKNDFRDAEDICDGLVCNQWKQIVWMPPEEIEQLRYLLLRRDHFVRLCTREISSAKGLLRSRGLRTSGICLTTETGWKKLLQRTDLGHLLDALQMQFAVWKQAHKFVEKFDKQLARASKPLVQTVQLLTSVFGVGEIGALAFIAWVGDPHRFPTSNHLVAYLGLAPSTYDSGDKQRHGHITKQGPRLLRALLVELAHQCRRIKHPLNPYYRDLTVRKGKKCAVVAIAARLARILWQMWRKNTPFDVGKLNVIPQRVEKVRVYLYEKKKGSRPTRTTPHVRCAAAD
jgi:transposase